MNLQSTHVDINIRERQSLWVLAGQLRSTPWISNFSKCLSILYYGMEVYPLVNIVIYSMQFDINSCYSKINMINSNDDITHCQDVFRCLPFANLFKRRTAKLLKKYKEDNYNNIVCQACIRYWLSSYHSCWLIKFLLLFIFAFFSYCLLSTVSGGIKMYIQKPQYAVLEVLMFQRHVLYCNFSSY